MVPRELAVELTDHIIDYLWDDRRTLIACSLTSRAWLPVTRYHLFCTVKLARPADSIRLEAVLRSSAANGTNISHYVRELHIMPDLAEYASDKWGNCQLPSVLTRLRRVQRLKLGPLTWQPEFTEGAGMMLRSFTQLKALFLEDVFFDDIGDMLHFLAAYPNLSTLHLLRCLCRNQSPTSAFPVSPQLELCTGRLEELSFQGLSPGCSAGVVKWLDSSYRLCLRKLEWSGDKRGDEQMGLVRLLRDQRVAANLEHLHIDILQNDNKSLGISDSEMFDFSTLTRIRKVYLEVRPDSREVAWLSHLSRIPSPDLQQIRFIIRGPDIRLKRSFYDDLLDWKPVDEALAERVKNLPGFSIAFEVFWYGKRECVPPEAIDHFTSLLPKLRAAGTPIDVLYSDL